MNYSPHDQYILRITCVENKDNLRIALVHEDGIPQFLMSFVKLVHMD